MKLNNFEAWQSDVVFDVKEISAENFDSKFLLKEVNKETFEIFKKENKQKEVVSLVVTNGHVYIWIKGE